MSVDIDLKTGAIEYSPDYRLRHTDDVLSVCAGLISIQYQGSRRIVRLAHPTVREYFLEAKVPGLVRIPPNRRKAEAQKLIAHCCLAQLRYLDSLKQPVRTNDDGSPKPSRPPQSLRWFLSDLHWAFGLDNGQDLFWVLSKAIHPSEDGLIESYIGLNPEVSALLRYASSKLSPQDLQRLRSREVSSYRCTRSDPMYKPISLGPVIQTFATSRIIELYERRANPPDVKPAWWDEDRHKSAEARFAGGHSHIPVIPIVPAIPVNRVRNHHRTLPDQKEETRRSLPAPRILRRTR